MTIEYIVSKFKQRFPGLPTIRGDAYTFKGIQKYIHEFIKAFSGNLGKSEWIFEVDDKARKLTHEKTDAFHFVVAKINVLCNKSPVVEDLKKFCRVMKYLSPTIDSIRVVRANNIQSMYTYCRNSPPVIEILNVRHELFQCHNRISIKL